MRTDITVILDRSGSMGTTRDDAMHGFNALVADQKTADGMAWLSLVQFDDKYQVDYTETPMADVPSLTPATYQPRGSTALLDAIGRTIEAIDHRLAARSMPDRPDKIIVVIITDGQENASQRFTGPAISEKIAHQRDDGKWEFIFIGSNQDAIMSAEKMSIPMMDAMSYSSSGRGTRAALDAASMSLSARRSGKAGAFTDVQRSAAMEDEPASEE
jgi:uncharacterized protein YegL